ncbi:MAG: SDR family NAD(P)-dependent oxidoreductase [Acidimicrobiales bacterium]
MADDRALFGLEGKVAIVTGASSGFGAHFSRLLAANGATVVAAARRRERLDELANGSDAINAVSCDVSNDDDCKRLVDTTVERFGGVHVLINNAGLGDPGPAIDESMEEFRYTVEVNLNACFLLSRLVAVPMTEQAWGSIVNIASVHGLVASAPNNQAGYAASKGGLVNLTRELAVQWVRHGIRVNAIAPGYFETELTEEMIADDGGARWITRNTPMRRPGVLEELDGPVLLLASDAGSYITGQTIAVDGGWTAR